MQGLIIALAAQLATSHAAQAATLVVDRIDDDPTQMACTDQPIDCTLRGAVLFAELSPGPDEIILPEDTVTLSTPGSLNISTDVTVRGVGLADSVVTSAVTFDQRAFRVWPGGTLTLEDLALTEFGHIPSAFGGGAIAVEDDASAVVTLRAVRLAGNRAVVGGALLIGSTGAGDPVRLQIYDSIIEDNYIDGAAVGAVAGCLGGALAIYAPTIIERTSILRNTANNARGGGICVTDTELTISDSTIANNEVEVNHTGAGIYADNSQLTITGSIIENNDIVGGTGGAIYARGGELSVTDSEISDNVARIGGIALVEGVDAQFTGSTLSRNGTYQLASNDSILNLSDVVLLGSFRGISLVETDFTATDLLVQDHTAPLGGGLHARDSVVRLTDCTFTGNEATLGLGVSGLGGAIYLADSALQMRRCTLSNNQAVAAGGALAIEGAILSSIWNSTFSNNQADSAEAISVTNAQDSVSLRHVTMAASNGNSQIELINSDASFSNSAIDGFCNLFLGGQTPISLGGNVVGDLNCFLDGPDDLVTDNLDLLGLGDFGGPNLTHLPGANSPVLDIAFDNCRPTDQRGIPRDTPCDAGAVERQPADDSLFSDGFEASP